MTFSYLSHDMVINHMTFSCYHMTYGYQSHDMVVYHMTLYSISIKLDPTSHESVLVIIAFMDCLRMDKR